MKKSNEFWKSLLIFLPTGALISYITYSGNLLSAVVIGYVGALSIFFVPMLFKKYVKKTITKLNIY